MRAQLRRYGAAPLLAVYCGLLCLAATPRGLVPVQLGAAHQGIRSLLWDAFRVKAGEEVFVGNTHDLKPRLICLTVIGLSERQPDVQTVGFQSFPQCEAPWIHLHSSPFALALTARVGLLFSRKGDMERLLAKGPGDEHLRAISRFFCTSPRSRIRGSDEVVMAVEYHAQHYYSGEITEQLEVIHEHVCKRGESIPRGKLGFAAEKLSSGRIILRSTAR